jgi:hypothetical protein
LKLNLNILSFNILLCDAGEGWRRSAAAIMLEMKKCYKESRKRGISYNKTIKIKEGRVDWSHLA